jgi:hypothetical protein
MEYLEWTDVPGCFRRLQRTGCFSWHSASFDGTDCVPHLSADKESKDLENHVETDHELGQQREKRLSKTKRKRLLLAFRERWVFKRSWGCSCQLSRLVFAYYQLENF